MTKSSTNEDETDPSTPTARRSSPAARVEGTDPGVGEPVVEPVAPPLRPLGIVVPGPGISTMTPTPPPTAAQQAMLKHKDSVEILLDGMTDQRLERTRTTPQSDGQAAAAYHAEHTPHPSGKASTGDDVPKVLLDRPLTPTSVSTRRSPAPARPYSSDATVFVPPERLGLRIAVAVVAGLLVASIVFLVLVLTRGRPSGAGIVASAPTPPPVLTQANAAAAGTAAVPPAAPAPAEAVPTAASADAPEGSAIGLAPAASSGHGHGPAAPVSPASRRKAKAGPASSTDVGEFRTNF